jgi:eukaryotic-like serine/threonine-protein kinase
MSAFMKVPAPEQIGRFQIVSRLGEGAQGIVYLAMDPVLQRQVAIKVVQNRSTKARALRDNFLQEARIVSKLQHPHVVSIFEAEELEGTLYLVFEYVDGISLQKLIERKALTVSKAVALMRQILDGVGYAHQHGIVHRDLKPANILVSRKGVARVMDFGLSGKANSGRETGDELKGTLRYMSPEHFSETPVVGRPSDVFALGLIFFEMLTLSPAISGFNHFNTIYKTIFEPTVAPSLLNPEVDEGLDRFVLKAVQKDPNSRYANADSMKKALEDYVARKKRGQVVLSVEGPTHSTIDFLLRRMQRKTDFPAFSECILEVNRLTSSTSEATAKEVASVILRDYSLTNKLLKLVNSSFYGQVGGSVTSIQKAVVILGLEQVRLAASSLLLFTHLQGKAGTTELRDTMVKSFMSGIMARNLARRARISRTEVAFLCSMFHDLGTNLTIYYFPEEYEEIKSLVSMSGQDFQGAARSVLGVSLDELGVNVARAWKFPESIIYCMRGLPSGPVEKPGSNLDLLRHFSVFANELCGLAGTGRPEDLGEPLSRLVQRFEGSFSVSESEALTLLYSTVNMVKTYSAVMNIDPETSPFIQRLLKAIKADGPHEAGASASQSMDTSGLSEGDDSPMKREGAAAEGNDRTAQVHGLQPAEAVASSARIWEWVLKLPHRFGLTKQ